MRFSAAHDLLPLLAPLRRTSPTRLSTLSSQSEGLVPPALGVPQNAVARFPVRPVRQSSQGPTLLPPLWQTVDCLQPILTFLRASRRFMLPAHSKLRVGLGRAVVPHTSQAAALSSGALTIQVDQSLLQTLRLTSMYAAGPWSTLDSLRFLTTERLTGCVNAGYTAVDATQATLEFLSASLRAVHSVSVRVRP